ncbi:hypothetical protein GCM10011374_39890 [Kocuria dechangensis]|uniref:Putative Flp pilus-assembly TadG-like N-terminal domain-containing protein n=1 Tax=Kocuria dechangensis TaxID=1176249 RepID=A0A917M0I7_9MICC|nr:Tad domain-containing protein [Kocuria dechangensis]GGG71237.1 hypothetical protein GCM10011374_39890 [Kocuria dechangensis]
MRRLTHRLERSLIIHHDKNERGAVTVIVALCLVVMLGFVALALDFGLMYSERAELQSSADAAALAVAQKCVAQEDGLDCSRDNTTDKTLALAEARKYATGTVRDGMVDVDQPSIVGNTVRVTTHALDSDGEGPLALNFGVGSGVEEIEVGATAMAEWYRPNKGPAVLPIVISPCDFHLNAGPQLLQLHSVTGTKKSPPSVGCPLKSSSGANIPGGFGFIDVPSTTCTATVQVGQTAYSDPGNDLPSQCVSVLNKHVGQTVLLPLYKDLGSTGNTGWYKIEGWVAFKLLGWRFPGITPYDNTRYSGATCSNPCTGIIGEFVRFASLDEAFTSGGPNYGAAVVGIKE